MWVERFLLNASVTLPSLCRVEIVTTFMAFIQQQCARFLQVAHLKFSTAKNLPSCSHNLSIMVMRQCMSWQRCVPFAWVLSKAGELSIIAKMLPVHHAGLKSISMVPCSGLTRCWFRWGHLEIQFLLFPENFSVVNLAAVHHWHCVIWVVRFMLLAFKAVYESVF